MKATHGLNHKLIARPQTHRLSRERGAMLPIIAVVAITVIFVLVAVGFDTTRIKRASSELSRHAEAICRDSASVAVIQRDAVRRFRNQVNELVASKNNAGSKVLLGTTIVDARFIIPTMPNDSSFCPYDNVAACASATPEVSAPTLFNTLLNDAAPEPAPYGPCTFNCANYPSECQSDCTFIGNINGLAGYPPQLWNNIRNAGNTAACEFNAMVESTLLGKRKITVKSTWWIPVRGKFDYSAGDVPGLTIAIAPHMTTDVADKRFQFCNQGDPSCGLIGPSEYPDGDLSFRRRFDPLYEYDVSTSGSDFPDAFTGQPPVYSFAPAMLKRPERISGWCRRVDTWNKTEAAERTECKNVATSPSGFNSLSGPAEQRDPSTGVYSDREQMLAACMNPAILLRNILTSSIVEHASRHGQLRMGTELLLVGTQGRNSVTVDLLAKGLSQPVVMVPFRSDLAKDAYQIPFVTYQGGRNTFSVPPEYEPAQQGRINPFEDDPNDAASPAVVTTKTKAHQALIAAQLRYCYHLYENQAKTIERIPTAGIFNSNFEPAPLSPASEAYKAYDRSLRKVGYDPGDLWDQDLPWGGPGSMTNTRLLNGAELVSALGSVQKCPYEQGGLDGNFIGQLPCTGSNICDGVCRKPPLTPAGAPTLDLRPDLLGLMYYLASEASQVDHIVGALPAPPMRALNSPGLFPYAFAAPGPYPLPFVDAWYPMAPDNYSLEPNLKSPIVIITHQRLSEPERNEICTMVAPSGSTCAATGSPGLGLFANRPITVIYMPTHEGNTSAHILALQDFRQAFFIPEVAGSTSKSDNALFVFSPYLEEHNLGYPGRAPVYPGDPALYVPDPGVAADSWQYYRAYWKDLVTAPDGQDIDTAARNIFFNRILTEDIKF